MSIIFRCSSEQHQQNEYTCSVQSEMICNVKDLFTAEAKFIGFDFNEYISIENMIICLKSRFAPTEDRDYLVQLLGNITDQQSVQTKDDGITQSATVKSGIQLVGEQTY